MTTRSFDDFLVDLQLNEEETALARFSGSPDVVLDLKISDSRGLVGTCQIQANTGHTNFYGFTGRLGTTALWIQNQKDTPLAIKVRSRIREALESLLR